MLPEHIIDIFELTPASLATLACVNTAFKDCIYNTNTYNFVKELTSIIRKLDNVESNWTLTLCVSIQDISFFKLRKQYIFKSIAGYRDYTIIEKIETLDELLSKAFTSDFFLRFLEKCKNQTIRAYCYGINTKRRFYRQIYVERNIKKLYLT